MSSDQVHQQKQQHNQHQQSKQQDLAQNQGRKVEESDSDDFNFKSGHSKYDSEGSYEEYDGYADVYRQQRIQTQQIQKQYASSDSKSNQVASTGKGLSTPGRHPSQNDGIPRTPNIDQLNVLVR
jgi:hypothetical protein